MPDDVRATIEQIIQQKSSINPEEYLRNLEQSGRYQLECWS